MRTLFPSQGDFCATAIIDHQILGIHYVRQVPNYTVYNLTFLAVGGVVLLLVGWLLMKTSRRDVIEL
jgi:uncharacterized membrane protein